MNLQELRDKINKLGVDLRAIVDKATGESREMTSEEKQTFDKMDNDRERLLDDERRLAKVEAIEQGTGRRSAANPVAQDTRQHGQAKLTSLDRLEGFRAWMLAGSDQQLTAQQRASAEKAGVNVNSKQFTLRLPEMALRSNRPEDVKRWEERAMSTLTGTSPEDGSYLIADEMIQPLERALLAFGGVRQRATVVRTGTGAAMSWPTSNDSGNKGQLLAENTVVVEKDAAFGILTLNSYKFSSKMLLISVELMQDSATNLADFAGTILGERIGRITNDYFTTGTGSSEPNGIVTAATSSTIALAAQTPTYAEMVSIEHKVDPAYRTGGSWMFHDTMLAEVKKITDASTGRPIWLPNMIGGAPDTILGYPYTVNQSMAVAAGSGSGKSILFGQLSKYLVRDVRDVTLLRLDERYAEYHQVAFLAFSRHDGDLLDAGTHPVVYGANKS